MSESILQPALALMLLTFVVWLYMGVLRLRFLSKNRISPRHVATPELMNSVVPDRIQWPANNLKNLFELPVIFYVICAFTLALHQADGLLTGLAWTYVLARAAHSAIHCTVNLVRPRFAAYMASSIVLWLMVARLAWTAM